MAEDTSDSVRAAIANARRQLALDDSEAARVWEVARLSTGERRYLLVVFGPSQGATGLATADPTKGSILESARLPGTAPHGVMSGDEAAERAGFPPGTEAQLVWDPTRRSRSPFYPLWHLRHEERTAWVDAIRGEVWESLDPDEAPRGGGGGHRA